jgi:translocation and assembly module TamB
VHLEKLGATLKDETLSATVLDATASIDGSLRKQTMSLTLEPQGLTLEDERLGSGKLALQASWDLSRPSVELHVDGKGDALPEGKLALSASIDRKTRVVTYSADGSLIHLAALEPFLAQSDDHWVDLSDLRVGLTSKGTLSGIIKSVDKQGVPELERRAWLRVSGDGETDLTLEQVHYVDVSGVDLTVPKMGVHAKVRAEGEHRTLEVDAHIARASLEADDHRLDLTELRDKITMSATGDPRSADLEATHTLTIGKLVQDWVKAYPIANLSWSGHARRGSDGTLHVDQVVLDNPGGGTRLSLHGALILPRMLGRGDSKAVPLVGFRSMTVQLQLEQSLGNISGDPQNFRGGGSLALTADVASGDLHRFHIVSSTNLRKATVELPQKKMSFVGLDGTLPVTEDLRLDKKKMTFAEIRETNQYPTLRFSDQHPFLSGSGGLSADKITVGNLTLTKVAGNLRLQRNLFAIDQLEAETRGGHITGQCLLAMKGIKSTVQMRLRMTGIEALHGGVKERFDGNTALVLSVADRTIEGRAEILRIGRNHLYDLLDQYDPHHSDGATNRVRTALELGYPDHVRILFERGFASYSITFGGLARLVKVSDVKGIPTGPLVDKYLGPLFALEKTP